MLSVSNRNIDRPQDWLNLVLAALLIVSPWVLGFADHTAAARTAWSTGIVIGVLSIAAIVQFAEWEEWVNMVLGLWLICAPWLVGFSHLETAMRTHVVLGALIALVAAWELWSVRHQTSAHI